MVTEPTQDVSPLSITSSQPQDMQHCPTFTDTHVSIQALHTTHNLAHFTHCSLIHAYMFKSAIETKQLHYTPLSVHHPFSIFCSNCLLHVHVSLMMSHLGKLNLYKLGQRCPSLDKQNTSLSPGQHGYWKDTYWYPWTPVVIVNILCLPTSALTLHATRYTLEQWKRPHYSPTRV